MPVIFEFYYYFGYFHTPDEQTPVANCHDASVQNMVFVENSHQVEKRPWTTYWVILVLLLCTIFYYI